MERKHEIIIPNRDGLKLVHKYETFVKIEGTKKFFVSTYGRVAVKRRNERYSILPLSDRYKIGFIGERRYRTVFVKKLVANAFLINIPGREYIWHIDRNRFNNKYQNLIFVTREDYIKLLLKEINCKDLDYIQYYYPVWAFNPRMQKQKYEDMLRRRKKGFGEVCDEWMEDEQSFYRWLESESYPCIAGTYELDKDILIPGNKLYSPNTCCLVPKEVNLLFEMPKKYIHKTRNNGVNEFYFIQPGTSSTKIYKPTEALAKQEYIRFKSNFIRKRAVENKHTVTNKIYHAMLDYANAFDGLLT